jgi:diguanylate cyclase (GGDEF)-like protein
MALRDLLAPQTRRMTFIAAAVLCVGLGLTFAACDVSERRSAADMQRRFADDASEVSRSIGQRLHAHAEVLVGMQGLYASLGHVDRAQFRRYIDVLDLGRRYPGFQALQELRHVTPDRLGAFVADVRADKSVDLDGLADFAVRPPGPHPVYNVVEFVEPISGNENALGFDAGANPAQLDSLLRSAATGRIIATPPVKLVQDTSGGLGFIIRAPIYRAGEPVQTVAQRHAALYGFVASVYRFNDLINGILDPRTLKQMHIQVTDRGYARPTSTGTLIGEPENPAGPATLMYDSAENNLGLAEQVDNPVGLAVERSLVVGERVWRVMFTANPGPAYRASPLVSNVIFGSGIGISVLTMLLVVMTLHWRRISGHLGCLDAEARALVDHPLAGILFTAGHDVVRCNARIAELCGWDVEELSGIDIGKLIAGDADLVAFDAALIKIRHSGMAAEVALRLRHSDGAILQVDACGKPLATGVILWVIEDKTAVLAAEAERRAHARAIEEANARLTASLQQAEIRAKEIALLTEFSGVVQSCQTPDEIFATVQTYAGLLFAEEAGALYYVNAARDGVLRGAHWGTLQADMVAFPIDDCWAMRRGSTLPVLEASQSLVCDHVGPCGHSSAAFICQPLIAQNNLLGLLYREHASAFSPGADQLATMLAEQVSLAMANLELREQLRRQAVRDPLTDLYNRRYLEDMLARETARSARDNAPLAVALLDIDHFKVINDSHGHQAGDIVLRALGNILLEVARKTDIVGRFGGEEFLLLLPGTGLDVAQQRVEQLLDAVRRMTVMLPAGQLDGITASVGLAVMPLHVAEGHALIAAADAALYRAKGQGRNRMVVTDKRNRLQAPSLVPDLNEILADTDA